MVVALNKISHIYHKQVVDIYVVPGIIFWPFAIGQGLREEILWLELLCRLQMLVLIRTNILAILLDLLREKISCGLRW